MARDLVLFDRVDDNPYRRLMPTAADHPALLNGMLAVAARHHSNLCGTPVSRHLPYKGRSFNHLSRSLRRHERDGVVDEATLAVVMLFIFFETLDGGPDTWRIHLRGARRLVRESLALGDSLSAETSAMLAIFMNHVTLVDIIGRTLAFRDEPECLRAGFDTEMPEFLSVLRAGEAYNFLGCPAHLLEAIHAATQLKGRWPTATAAAAAAPTTTTTLPTCASDAESHCLEACQQVLSQIDDFDPDEYMTTRSDVGEPDDQRGLLQLVRAYKCAARIYAVETLFPVVAADASDPLLLAPLHDELRMHLSALDDGSMCLKGAVWLVFIAGTGAYTAEQREWTRQQLDRVWALLPQGNIRNAGAVLEELWLRCDATGQNSWQLLTKCGRDWLFV